MTWRSKRDAAAQDEGTHLPCDLLLAFWAGIFFYIWSSKNDLWQKESKQELDTLTYPGIFLEWGNSSVHW